MQVLCMASNGDRVDIVCPACGQKYAVYYSRQLTAECERALAAVHAALLGHHDTDKTAAAHPAGAFNVPEWKGPAHMSGAALLSGAPINRLAGSAAPERLAS